MTDLQPANSHLPALAGEAAALVGEVHAASLHVQTARKLAKQLGAGVTPVNRALLAQAERMAELADAIEAGQRAGQIADLTTGRGNGVRAADTITLPDLGTNRQRYDDAKKIRGALYEDGDAIRAQVETSKIELSIRAWIRRGAQGEATANEWYTPPWLFQQLAVRFDIDVCAPTDPAMRTCPADTYYTEQDDGLTQPWTGTVWCNPPYSDPAPWIHRWADHPEDGLLLTHFSVASRRMPELWTAADGIRLFAGMWFDRPDGGTEKPFWGLMLAARGPLAVTALENVDNEWASPLWIPYG
jgi:hypothetical protein